MEERRIKTDVLVIGGAGAGLRAALAAKSNGVDVILASKMPVAGSSSTALMAGWITCSTEDSEDELFRQIVHTGGYLNNQRLVEVFVKDAIERIPELKEFGVDVSEKEGRENNMPGHYTTPRVQNQPRGYSLLQPMRESAEKTGVHIMDNVMISQLMITDGSVVGAVGIDLNSGDLLVISAKSVILATGGGSDAFIRNNNPKGTTGDGFALAYNAGAELVDMECISLNLPRSMIPELFQIKGDPPSSFMESGMSHYFLGGVKIDEDGRSSVPGLFAAGEVTGGLFGSGRLGGSAIGDIIVFGARAGIGAAQWFKDAEIPEPNEDEIENAKRKLEKMTKSGKFPALEVHTKIRTLLWKYMGIVKTDEILKTGLKELEGMRDEISNMQAGNSEELQAAIEVSNIYDLGRIIATASLLRKETRGNYWRSDYPNTDNENWLKNIVVYKKGEDAMTRIDPVIMTRLHRPSPRLVGEGCFWYFPKIGDSIS